MNDYPVPLPLVLKGKRVPIVVRHGSGGRSNCTGRIAVMYPDILYTDVVYIEYYGTKEIYSVRQVWRAYVLKEPLEWPHAVPMDRFNKRAKRRERDRIRRTKHSTHG